MKEPHLNTPNRSDRWVREHSDDPYHDRHKLPEPTSCLQCEAVYHDGRWHWAPRPAPAHQTLCPACRRINDGYPTDIHLPRRIGEALQRAYDGDLEFHFDEDAYFLRVTWRRA